MARTGLSYYYNRANLSNDDIAFYYDFNTSGSTASSITGSGFSVVGNTGSFWSSSGSGFFSGTILKPNTNSANYDNFSSIIVFERNVGGNAVLLSTLQSGIGGISGFVLGLNDANKAYLTCYDQENKYYITNTTNLTLGRKNALSSNKSNNIFSLGKFNFFNQDLDEEMHIFPSDCNTDFSSLFFGGLSGNGLGLSDRQYTGHIDEILFLNTNISEDSIKQLYKGFYKYEPYISEVIISETDSYTYPEYGSVSNPVWEEMQSGALDYISNNIFNTTGIGSIRVVSSGTISGGTGYVSGNLSGTVSLKSGYYEVTTGTRVTGYSWSGQVPSASGITGYVDVSIFPITVFSSGSIYQLSAQSGVSGVTEWTPVFSGALYETIVSTGFIEDTLNSNYSLNFSYTIPNLSGNSEYLHIADYSNNGNKNIVISHDLTYSGNSGVNFRAFKTTQLLYGSGTTEGNNDINYISGFMLDGVLMNDPISSGDILELIDLRFDLNNFNFNKKNNLDLVSGLFSYTGNIDYENDSSLYFNGVFASQSEYFLNNNYFNTSTLYDRSDSSISDISSGVSTFLTSQQIGSPTSLSGKAIVVSAGASGATNRYFVFFNGLKLIRTIDYNSSSISGGSLIFSNNYFSGVTGLLETYSLIDGSGIFINSQTNKISYQNSANTGIVDSNSLLFYNRLRQELNVDYIETSSIDLVYNLTGFYNKNLTQIINI